MICRKCGVLKLSIDYSKHARVCKACKNQARAPKRREELLKARYALTIDNYERLADKQQNLCAICERPETSKHQNGNTKRLAVDHCHTTKAVRGLLCKACNQALGLLKENIDSALNLVTYVQERCK